MSVARVRSLHYCLETEPTLAFENTPPIEWSTNAFDMRLADGTAVFTLKEDHATEESAKKRVEASLHAWEISAALQFGRSDLHFRFDKAEIDEPSPTGSGAYAVRLQGYLSATGRLNLRVMRKQYPTPPHRFSVSLDTQAMWQRYEGFIQGREPLLSMAMFCLTVVTFSARNEPGKSRAAAAKKYAVDKEILDRFSALCDLGDEATARKRHARNRALTDQENQWVQAAAKMLILRIGEYAHDPSAPLQLLTMADLPA